MSDEEELNRGPRTGQMCRRIEEDRSYVL